MSRYYREQGLQSKKRKRGVKKEKKQIKLYVPRTPGGQTISDSHYFDTERTATAIPSVTTGWAGTEMDPNTSAMLTLFAPVEGNDIQNRYARKVFLKKIHIYGSINIPEQTGQAAPEAHTNVRLVLYQDCQTNASNTNVAQLVLLSGAASDAIHMMMSTANFGRFKIWKDKMFTFQNAATSGLAAGSTVVQSGLCKNFKMVIRPNIWVNYNATNGGTVADIVDHSFHLLANADQIGFAPTIRYKVRSVFKP